MALHRKISYAKIKKICDDQDSERKKGSSEPPVTSLSRMPMHNINEDLRHMMLVKYTIFAIPQAISTFTS